MSDDPDDEEDPFASMEAPDDDSDPFESLSDAADGDTDQPAHESADGDTGPATHESAEEGDSPETDPDRLDENPFTRESTPPEAGTDTDTTDPAPGRDDPSDDAWPGSEGADASSGAGGIDTVSGSEGTDAMPGSEGTDALSGSEGPESDEDMFAEMGAGRTGSDTGDEDPFEAFEAAEVDEVDPDEIWERLSQAERDEGVSFDENTYYEVSKHRFCEQCEYFSAPPEVACNYEGADIVEFLDMETVRLVNCPIVAEHRRLGDEG